MADKKISQLTAATTPLAGTEVLPIVQSGSTVKVANNDLRPKQIQSNATSGVLQIVGPAAAATRVMTTPDANFTIARTDAGQTFTGNNTFSAATTSFNNGNGILNATIETTGVYHQYYKDSAVSWVGAVGTTVPGSGTAESAIVFSKYDGSWVRLMAISSAGDLVPKAAKGVNFTANTPAAGMTSQLLNWYEEGAFTPTFTNLTVVGTPTYTGTYVRIGRMVYVNIRIQSTTSTSSTAGTTYSNGGFPFVSANIYTTGVGVNTGNQDMFATAPIFGLSGGNTILYTPTWTALADVTITGFYFV